MNRETAHKLSMTMAAILAASYSGAVYEQPNPIPREISAELSQINTKISANKVISDAEALEKAKQKRLRKELTNQSKYYNL